MKRLPRPQPAAGGEVAEADEETNREAERHQEGDFADEEAEKFGEGLPLGGGEEKPYGDEFSNGDGDADHEHHA